MSGNFKKEDLRVIKTRKALKDSLVKLLTKTNFSKITVNDICEEAFVSRASFYAHFNDKYDLLKYLLIITKNNVLCSINNSPTINQIFILSKMVDQNSKLLINLLDNYNNESYTLITEIISQLFKAHFDDIDNNKNNDAMARFCSGGIVYMVLCQVKSGIELDYNDIYLFIKHINYNKT